MQWQKTNTDEYHKSKYSKAESQAYKLFIKYGLPLYLDTYTFIMTLKARAKFIVLMI